MILLSRVKTRSHFIRAAQASSLRKLKAGRSYSGFAVMLRKSVADNIDPDWPVLTASGARYEKTSF
ncbi:MAG: hypothetical protein PVJ19_19330 [Desulfobacteraceae bacterium]